MILIILLILVLCQGMNSSFVPQAEETIRLEEVNLRKTKENFKVGALTLIGTGVGMFWYSCL